MNKEQRLEIVINFAAILAAVARGIPSAIEVGDKLWAALKGGITPEEWQALIAERDEVLGRVIAKTDGE